MAKVRGYTDQRHIAATTCAVASVLGAVQAVIAIYGFWDGRTSLLLAIIRVINGARIPIVTDLCAQGVAGIGQVAMSEMSREGVLTDPYGVVVGGVVRWDVTDIDFCEPACAAIAPNAASAATSIVNKNSFLVFI